MLFRSEWGSNLLESASQVVSAAIDAIVQFFTDLPYKIGYALGFVIGKLIEFGINAVNWVKTNVPIIIDNIVTFFSELPGKFDAMFGGMAATIMGGLLVASANYQERYSNGSITRSRTSLHGDLIC